MPIEHHGSPSTEYSASRNTTAGLIPDCAKTGVDSKNNTNPIKNILKKFDILPYIPHLSEGVPVDYPTLGVGGSGDYL